MVVVAKQEPPSGGFLIPKIHSEQHQGGLLSR